MFGLVNRTRFERVSNDSGVSSRKTCSPPPEEEDEEEMDEETYERTARLCHIRKRSIEIPLENLLSGMIFLSGGRDVRNGPVLSVIQPPDLDIDLIMELHNDEIIDMLTYFTYVPSEEIRSHKFSVVIAADQMYDFFLKKVLIAMNAFQNENNLFHKVYLLTSRYKPDMNVVQWAFSIDLQQEEIVNGIDQNEDLSKEVPAIVLPCCVVKTPTELFQYIKSDQLTFEFGGSLKYNHQDWVRFRMQVEPFICDVVGVSKRLAQAIAPFTQEELPKTLEEAEKCLKSHHLQRRKTLETLHVDELASEGEKIKERMCSSSKEQLQSNPDFNATLETIEVLLNRVENVRARLDTLWNARNEKLEANLKQKKFEKEAHQILEWFEQYAEEFFETHNGIGESLEVAQALVNELLEFEENTKQILSRSDHLLKNASELSSLEHLGCDVKGTVKQIKQHISDFHKNMETRKKRLNNAVKLHNIMDKSINWCIEGVAFLSDYDILSMDPNDIDPECMKAQLDEFQSHFPPPKKEEIKLLTDTVASMENRWGKEGFEFALNRIVELHDRFELYYKLLDEMIGKRNKQISEVIDSVSGGYASDGDIEVSMHRCYSFPRQGGMIGRRLSESGKEIQVTVLDIDKRAHQAISLLEKSNNIVKQLDGVSNTEEAGNCSGSESDCVSLLEFLNEVDVPNTSPTVDLLSVKDDSEIRKRSYSAPEDMTDSGTTLKRSRSLNRRTRTTVSPRPPSPSSPRPEISCPSNPQFTEEPEKVSLDDNTVEENPADMTTQTAHAKHRRKLMEELLTTEETYIRDLERIITNYVPFMDDVKSLPPRLVGKKDILFGLLPTFLNFSRDVVLPRIRKCIRAPIKMGLVFLDHEEEFLDYAMYFKNKIQQDQLIIEEDLFFRGLQEKVGDPLRIDAYLIKPVQRMTKYRQFLEQMVKYTTKGKELQEVQKGAKKEYFGKLKEALKMVDFVLRHGNDLLALESLKGYTHDIDDLGRILRVGDLVVVDGFTKHRRKVFLFEKSLLFAKTRKMTRAGPTGSEVYDYKQQYKTSELMLREQVPGHENRFAVEMTKGKETIIFQTDTVEEKQEWVQEIWDLFFSQMLTIRDDKLQSHGTQALTGIMVTGSATLTRGRPLSHSMRKRVHTAGVVRKSLQIPPSDSRESISSVGSATSLKELASYIRNKRDSRNFPAPYSPVPISPRSSLAITFHENSKRDSTLSSYSSDIGSTPRDSMISSASNTTLSSISCDDPESTLGPNTIPSSLSSSGPTLAKIGSQDSMSSISLNESFKLFNTPL